MKKIDPYKNVDDAISSLDNGGRFYNILTKADDGVISKAELGKVAGIFNDKQRMILFFELSISKITLSKKEAIIAKLEEQLQLTYRKYRPHYLLPSEANAKGEVSSNAIITGIPKLTDSKSDFVGFIMIPLTVGNVTTFSMIPIIDQYDVYEIRDNESSESFLIAHSKGSAKLPDKKIQVAGVLKELKSSKEEKKASKKFLEAIYYLDINQTE